VLADLGADGKPTLVVFNKIDKLVDPAVIPGLRRHFPDALFISVHCRAGLDELIDRISTFVSNGTDTQELRLPSSASEQIARLHRQGRVLETEYIDDEVRIVARLTSRLAADYAEFVVNARPKKAEHSVHSIGDKISRTS
jgi:GTP-binding protein HflX